MRGKSTLTPLNPTRCPLCGGDNACGALTDPRSATCWCQSAEFGKDLIARVPAGARGKACICARCANAAVTPTSRRNP